MENLTIPVKNDRRTWNKLHRINKELKKILGYSLDDLGMTPEHSGKGMNISPELNEVIVGIQEERRLEVQRQKEINEAINKAYLGMKAKYPALNIMEVPDYMVPEIGIVNGTILATYNESGNEEKFSIVAIELVEGTYVLACENYTEHLVE